MPTYNKLVRDKIPHIISESGKQPLTRTLNEDEYLQALLQKFREELLEYQEAKTQSEKHEELADLLELVKTLATVEGADLETIEAIRQYKAQKRGGFQERIFLMEVLP